MTHMQKVRSWFSHNSGSGLVLPDGWFGRPYDNFHSLTETDGQLSLTFYGPIDVCDTGNELVISGYSRLEFDWREYGSLARHSDIYDGGEVRLVAHPG